MALVLTYRHTFLGDAAEPEGGPPRAQSCPALRPKREQAPEEVATEEYMHSFHQRTAALARTARARMQIAT